MNLAELAGAFNMGSTLITATKQADQKRHESKLEVLNGAVQRLDQAIEVADAAWNQSSRGQAVDWQHVHRIVQEQLEFARGLLRHVGLDQLIPTGVTPLGQFAPPPLAPAFGPQMPGGGPFTAHTPQGFVPRSIPTGTPQLRTSFEAPAMNRLRSILRGIRQRLLKVRDSYLPGGSAGMAGIPDDTVTGRFQAAGPYTSMLFVALVGAAAFHGYVREKKGRPAVSAAKWGLPVAVVGGLFGPSKGNIAGLAVVAYAVSQGFAKPHQDA